MGGEAYILVLYDFICNNCVTCRLIPRAQPSVDSVAGTSAYRDHVYSNPEIEPSASAGLGVKMNIIKHTLA